MKLSDQTLTILKNFASVNKDLVINPGKVQRTLSADESILIEARLSEDFPIKFGIYDLNQFLGNVEALKSPNLEFNNNVVVITDGSMTMNYMACSPNLIISPPDDSDLPQTDIDISFELSSETFKKITKLAAMNSLTHITVLSKNGEIRLQTHDKSSDSSNFAYTKVGEYSGKEFSVSFLTENLKLIQDDYKVEITLGAFAKFINKANTLTYFIAIEK